MLNKAVFTLEDHPKAYIGYAIPIKGNHWIMPYFEFDVSVQILKDFEDHILYDKGNDQFKIWDEGIGDYAFIKGKEFITDEGIKHLYAIGSGNWLWKGIKCFDLALGIEDFIYEYDTYHYRDECIDRMQTAEAIQNQLKEFTVLQRVYEIWHNNTLTKDLKFEKLGGILTI